MHKIKKIMIIIFFCCLISSCGNIVSKNECLNYENFEKFDYKDSTYILPDNYYEIHSQYDFYGKMHKIGYTIGVYGKVFETYILDNDIDENIVIQKGGRYFWFKEGYTFPIISELKVNKLLIEKLDSEGYIIKEKEFSLDDITYDDMFVEYNLDIYEDTFLLDYNNFLTYRIRYIYENNIITKKYNKITIYNDNLFLEKYNAENERKIYILKDNSPLNLYEFILNNFN